MTWRTHMKYSMHGWFFKANSKSCHVKWKFLVSLKTEFCHVIFCFKLGMWCFAQVNLWESMCCFVVTPHVLRTPVCGLWGEDTSTLRHCFLDDIAVLVFMSCFDTWLRRKKFRRASPGNPTKSFSFRWLCVVVSCWPLDWTAGILISESGNPITTHRHWSAGRR